MQIKVCGLEVNACHGVHEFEKTSPKKFTADVLADLNFFPAAKHDDLKLTVSYSDVCDTVADVIKNNVFNLIETLAFECAFTLMEKFVAIKNVEVCIHKPQAPVKHKFSDICVKVNLERCTAYLSLGSSLGDRKGYIDKAISLLDGTRGIKVEKVSSMLKTKPMGGVAKNEFLNCAVRISTFLSPKSLLYEIHRIESECGRVRDLHWGDRTLDIDIILFGNKKIEEDGLIIPHPEYKNRDFVLIPLKEIIK